MRGVNKLVLEVNPDGEYFEKALLFLKPEKQNATQKEISEGADRLLKRIEETKSESRKGVTLAAAIIGTAAGAGITFLTMLLSGFLG